MSTTRKIKADLIEGVVAPINYIRKGAGENIITSWNRFVDSGTRPVDGTGGSPNANVTWTLSTSSPLDGDASFLLTKDANNRQGEGVSYDFTIKNKDLAKVLRVGFDYEIVSGTYNPGTSSTDSDVIFYLYRVTATGRLIEPSIFKLDGGVSGVKYSFRSEFQTDSDATEYRAILYIASTSASAYTLKFDNFEITPSKNTYGAIVTEWTSYTGTFGGYTVQPSITTLQYRRVGSGIEVDFRITGGTTTGTTFTIPVPSGLSMVATSGVYGEVATEATTAANRDLVVVRVSDTTWGVGSPDSAAWSAALTGTNIGGGSGRVTGQIRAQIQGWGATATLGQDADTRVVGFTNTPATPTATVTGTLSDITWGTINGTDTHGGYNGTTTYTIPVSGRYRIKAKTQILGTYALDNFARVAILINGTVATDDFQRAGGALSALSCAAEHEEHFAAGTLVKTQVSSNATTPSIASQAGRHQFSVTRVPGPSQLAASETVVLSVSGTTSTVSSSQATVAPWTTVEVDAFGSFNATTGIWTCPAAGTYEISAQLRYGWASVTVGQAMIISIFKNNTTDLALNQETIDVSTKTFVVLNVDKTARLVAGDTIRIQASNAATTPNLNTSAAYGLLSIKKIGF